MGLLTFDIIDRCNLACPSCYHGLYGGTKQVMSLEDCKNILDHCTKRLGVTELEAYNWGEPLLCDQLGDFITLFSRYKDLKIYLSSNMNREIDDELVKKILRNVHAFRFSASGFCQKTYGQYHRGGSFNKVLANIRSFLRMRSSVGNGAILEWAYGITKTNRKDLDKAKQFCAQNTIDFKPLRYLVTPVSNVYKIYLGKRIDPKIYNLFYSSQDEARADIVSNLTPNHCQLIRHVVTDCRGRVMTCCADKIILDEHISEVPSIDRLIKIRLENDFCRTCYRLGLSGYYNFDPGCLSAACAS